MLNIYDLYIKMKDEGIVMAYHGRMSEELLSSVFQIMDVKPDENPQEQRRKKKVNNILVECLQNIFHHGEDFTGEKGFENENSILFLVCKNNNNRYRVITGNHMPLSGVSALKNKIDKVNSLSIEEVKNYYRDLLNNTELSEKGGAGLGMIDLVRKSGNKIEYLFDDVNEQLSFFTLIVNID